MKLATTLIEAAAASCWLVGTALLYLLTVAGGLLATALFLVGISWVLSAAK